MRFFGLISYVEVWMDENLIFTIKKSCFTAQASMAQFYDHSYSLPNDLSYPGRGKRFSDYVESLIPSKLC